VLSTILLSTVCTFYRHFCPPFIVIVVLELRPLIIDPCFAPVFTPLTDIVSNVLILQDMGKKLRNSKEKPLVCQKESLGRLFLEAACSRGGC
jgi:hypothetical protein